MRPKNFLRMAAGLLCLGLAAGATAQQPAATPPKPPFAFSKVDHELLENSNRLDRYFEEKGLVLTDPETTRYVASVGAAILPPDPPENVVWRFRIMRDHEVNAFALANGTIYVNTGLLARLENEAQLASVLAHEVTHILERHGYLENRSYRKKMVAMHVMAAVGSVAGLVGGVGGTTVSLVASLLPSIVVATIYGYSRELERAADKRAVVTLVDADYSAEEMINTFRLLQKNHEVELSQVFYSDHPKLQERIEYVTDLVNEHRPKTPHPKVEAERYLAAVEKAVRHNIGLDIADGRARTAFVVAESLTRRNPNSTENFFLLGEAFRALGPRTPQPTPEELSERGKKDTKKMVRKMTLQEYEEALMATPQGKGAWEVNAKKAEEAYRRALELDSGYAKAHRGLGFLYERLRRSPEGQEEFRKYLEFAPDALDRLQITRRLEALEKDAAKEASPPPR